MKLKDIVIVALLSVVGFVLSMAAGMGTQALGTFGVFVHVSLGSILVGPIYFVMCHKVPARGVVVIYYTLAGIIYSLIGFVPMLPVMIAAGLVGELCIWSRANYTDDLRLGISYVASQVIYALHGFFFILVLGVEGLVDTFPNLFTEEAAQHVKDTFFDPATMAIILVIELVAASFGAWLGSVINAKFFDGTGEREKILS
ncbi:MptD family putative ECF transporter S component [Corynebacterium mendelii]|uniref:MptD family putative ECF transporter S component n=1 Tax=Corynebacterium mendelii TaxID=2765362 RepID=A0A939E0Y0_9CORY|nr:MptD family putative ECF transporter S component [Corynebacterium mendelii]MBN9643818.1 MptD family putative ECF transporter S component [Corynebacterium mendelii]